MGLHQKNEIPEEVIRLRLCASLKYCGQSVESCLKVSDASDMSIYDDEFLRYTDWKEGILDSPKVFIAHNIENKKLILLPLDNKIICGPNITQGGVADCAVLTMNEISFIEFKTNVVSSTELNITSKVDDAIKQLWHTYDGIIKPRCFEKGIDISKIVNIDFYIVFNKELSVTSTMAVDLALQASFLKDYGFLLYFENEKNF